MNYIFHLFSCLCVYAVHRRPSLRPSFTRPLLQLLPPLVLDPSTTLCLQTLLLLRDSSFTPLMSSHPHPKPHPSSWPLLSHLLTRQCLLPSVLNWLTFSLAPWWTLGLSTLLCTKTRRKPSRLVMLLLDSSSDNQKNKTDVIRVTHLPKDRERVAC